MRSWAPCNSLHYLTPNQGVKSLAATIEAKSSCYTPRAMSTQPRISPSALSEVQAAFNAYRDAVEKSNIQDGFKWAYLDRADKFMRWLIHDFVPRPRTVTYIGPPEKRTQALTDFAARCVKSVKIELMCDGLSDAQALERIIAVAQEMLSKYRAAAK